MSLLIVSDLHISGSQDPLYRTLLSLLRDRARPGDTVILVGDIFDLFVGNKAVFVDRYSEFLEEAAKAIRQGVNLHYIEGNHDFLVHRAFARVPGMAIHPEKVTLEVDGKRFYFAHGDLVDAHDYAYRFLRWFFRTPMMKAWVTLMPGKWLDWIGRTSSYQSSKGKPRLAAGLTTQKIERLRRVYRNFATDRLVEGYDFVVMGHCHDLDEMSFNLGGRIGQYINVGFPRTHGSFLTWSPGDSKIGRERFYF